MKLTPWTSLYTTSGDPLIIAGPCSAESPEQLLAVAKVVNSLGINIMRAGVWKPRTELYRVIHDESIRIQTEIMNKESESKN